MKRAQAMMLSGPVPGQSLTDEPKAYAWEQPPMLTKPEDVFDYYLQKISDPEVSDNVLTMVSLGMPISTLVDSMMSGGVMEGIHSVDVKLIMKPQIGVVIKEMAIEAGIDYKESMDDYRDKDEEARQKRVRLLAAKLELRKQQEDMDKGDVLQQQIVEDIQEEPAAEEAAPKGLMAKEQ